MKPPEVYYCPHCTHPVDVPLPVEPLYTIADAAKLMPTTRAGLRTFLNTTNRGKTVQQRYKRFGPRIYRYLTASEVRQIREWYLMDKITWSKDKASDEDKAGREAPSARDNSVSEASKARASCAD